MTIKCKPNENDKYNENDVDYKDNNNDDYHQLVRVYNISLINETVPSLYHTLQLL